MLSAERLKLAICSNKTAFQNSLENIFAIKSVFFFKKKKELLQLTDPVIKIIPLHK